MKESLNKQEAKDLTSSQLIPIDVKEKDFQKLMNIYEMAMLQVSEDLNNAKEGLNAYYDHDVIHNISCRVKTPNSIINKMKRKKYDLNYKSLIENVHDIAGIRIVCQFKSDIPKVIEIIEENPNLEIIEERDYINNPKKSGYTGYHIIAQTPVNVGDAFANVKTEIQIRTMAMDFWSSAEHKIKYKSKNKLSKIDSQKMVRYAKIINRLDDKMMRLYKKYEI